jgi:hypothetical protein
MEYRDVTWKIQGGEYIERPVAFHITIHITIHITNHITNYTIHITNYTIHITNYTIHITIILQTISTK